MLVACEILEKAKFKITFFSSINNFISLPVEGGRWNVKLLSHVRLFATLWTVAYQAPLSRGFSRQEYWNGLPFPSPGDLPDPGIEPRSPALEADALTSEPPGITVIGCFYQPWWVTPMEFFGRDWLHTVMLISSSDKMHLQCLLCSHCKIHKRARKK